jgi:hypothetical protein
MERDLTSFIDQARQTGMDHATIFLLLRSAGWKDRQVAEAIANRELTIGIPERAGIGSPRDAFLHLLAFSALYAWVTCLIYLMFAYVEFAFPDPVKPTQTYAIESALSNIRWCMAALIVLFPLFAFVWGYLLRQVRVSPEIAKGGFRRWLSFYSLFLLAATVCGDLITAIYYFVEGDLTVRFLLKVASLFAITATLFLYLALTLRSEGEARR